MAKQLTLAPDLWQQCEQLYRNNPACFIAMQDQFGVNVNLFLLAVYLDGDDHRQSEANPISLSSEQWQELSLAVTPWDTSMLIPYRTIRRTGKTQLTAEQYQQMLEVELMLERKSQQLISNAMRTFTLPVQRQQQATATTDSNVKQYLQLLIQPEPAFRFWQQNLTTFD